VALHARPKGFAGLILVLALAAAACGSPTKSATTAPSAAAASGPVTLRLGYFANLTHAPAILGLADGTFARTLGSNVKIETRTFNAGPAAVEALFANAIDVTYVGPNPAVNAFQKSEGKAVRIIAGATSGGAALVVKPSITSASDLRGKKLATPQRGNTQDVALRSWLKDKGLNTTLEGGGDVSILPQENAQTLETFKAGKIDGAWVPEPWATRLVVEGGGKILVDEGTLWPGGKYATTVLLVRTQYQSEHPDVVKHLLAAHVEEIGKAAADPAASQTAVNKSIKHITGKALKEAVLRDAWARLSFTYDPLVSTIERAARQAKDLGLLKSADINGITDLKLLNEVLREANRQPVP
jgi:NitT/TauT family transport system substrate-binding protein